MALKALGRGLGKYLRHLLVAALFPLAWRAAFQMAGRHADADGRGRAKVGVAIVLGIALAAGGFLVTQEFRADAVDGIYGSLDARLARATGESDYQTYAGVAAAKAASVPALEGRIEEARAAGDEARAAQLEAALATTREDQRKAEENVSALEPNHALYLQVHEAVRAKDDAAAKSLLGSTTVTAANLEGRSARAFEIKDQAVADMDRMLWTWVLPGLAGLFYAPLVFALASIVNASFVASDTVGFKPYPGAGMGFFLLLGGFGVPALFFAAWALMDLDGRSREGQIAL